jgi:hypothetical protein
MSEITTDWTKQEFKAYLLSYCAKSNFFESDEEKKEILNLVSNETYDKIHKELGRDNDYQSVQKILHNLEKFNYSKDELNRLVEDVQRLFMADGTIDLLETNMLSALKRLVS